jgi:hypothetical protein
MSTADLHGLPLSTASAKDDVGALIDRVRRRHPVPPEKRIGHRAALGLLN